ncbi:MAG: histidine kinase, partial [Hyphomicrobiales bacterium]|nr:histidine kinase [Hyphomicrobiales bacterium]
MLKSARLSIALVGILLTALTGAIAFTNRALEDNKVLNGWVLHTYDVIQQANQLLADLVESETSRRGYMMSPQPIYLESYQRNAAEAKAGLDSLNSRVGDNPEQLGQMRVVRDLVERRLAEMEEGMRRWQAQGLAAGIAHLNDSETRAITAQSRAALLQVVDTETRLLNNRKEAAESAASRTQIWTIVIFLIAVTGILLTLYLLSRSNHQLSKTQALLRGQAATLQRTLDTCSEGIAAFDASGRIVTYNRNFFTLLDYPDHLGQQRAMFDEFTKFDAGRTAELLSKVSINVDSST